MPTVSAAFAAYLEDMHERQLRPVHIRTVTSRLGHFLEEFGDRSVETVTRADVGSHLTKLEATRADGTMAGISATHRAFWRWCHEHGFTAENLGSKLRRYDYTPSVRRAAQPEHVEKLAAAIPAYVEHRRGQQFHENDVRAGLLVSLSLDSGARRGEMANLRVADVKRSLQQPHWTPEGTAYVVGSKGKTGTANIVYFEQTAALFARWFEILPPSCRFVFSNLETGERLQLDSLGRIFARVCKWVGIPVIRSHAIRKRNICDIVDESGFAAAQQYAGHANVRTTQRHYYQANHNQTIKAAVKMNRRRRESAEEAAQMAALFGVRSEAD